MRDYTFISFFLGHDAGNECRELLNEHGLLEEARVSKLNPEWQHGFEGGCKLRLRFDDPRLVSLIESLGQRGVSVLRRHDREFSKAEVNAAPWLVLIVATAGLYGGVDYDQPYDYSRACPICGAGAQPEPPLIAELGKIGKKKVDHLVYEGHLIVSQTTAATLLEHDLTGFTAESVRTPRKHPSRTHFWLRVCNELPPLRTASEGLRREDPCPACDRSGYYWEFDAPWVPRLENEPVSDLSLSREYFGNWRQLRSTNQVRAVGGAQDVIVSQRAKRAFQAAGARFLNWIPVEIRGSQAHSNASAHRSSGAAEA